MLNMSSNHALLNGVAMGSIVTIFVTAEGVSSERRFDKGMLMSSFKERLEPITGVPVATMKLNLYSNGDILIGAMDQGDNVMLGYYPISDFCKVDVIDTNPYRKKNLYTDVSAVEKFEISQEEYEKRSDTVRAYKIRNKLGRFADPKPGLEEPDFKEEAANIKVGDRCLVEGGPEEMAKRGLVKYVGIVNFKPGYWVGVQYDEPLGKHNGTVEDVMYFVCPNNYGTFVRPNVVKVGDYPEENLFGDSDDDEM